MHLYMYEYMYVLTYVRMCVCIYVRTNVCMYICMCVYVHTICFFIRIQSTSPLACSGELKQMTNLETAHSIYYCDLNSMRVFRDEA
jgi:hypothetical protein